DIVAGCARRKCSHSAPSIDTDDSTGNVAEGAMDGAVAMGGVGVVAGLAAGLAIAAGAWVAGRRGRAGAVPAAPRRAADVGARTALGEFQQTALTDLESRQRSIDDVVRPIRESLAKVDAKLHDVETQRVGAYAQLSEQVRSLAVTQQQLTGETSNLVRALRTPHVRGRGGEIQRQRV